MLKPHHITNFPTALRWIALACVLAVVSAQTFALDHIHLDTTSEAACVVCGHTDTSAIVELNNFTSPNVQYTIIHRRLKSSQIFPTLNTLYEPRAPPAH